MMRNTNRPLIRNIIQRPDEIPLADLAHHPAADVRRAVMASLGQQPPPFGLPIALLGIQDANEWVRATAARTLGKLHDVQSIPSLLQLLQDPIGMVRASAAQALGAIGDVRCVPFLNNLLKDTESIWEGRQERVCDVVAAVMQWRFSALDIPNLPRFDETLRLLDEWAIEQTTSLTPLIALAPQQTQVPSTSATSNTLSVAPSSDMTTDEILSLWRKIFSHAIYHIIAIGVAALFLVIFVWFFSMSLRQPAAPPSPRIEWIPDSATFSNYQRIFKLVPMQRFIINSVIVSLVAVPLTILFASWAGFAMALLGKWTRGMLVTFSVLLLMVPITALWLPRFVLFTQWGLVDTLWALIIPAFMGSSPLFVLLFYWSFRRFPRELFESAQLDGANVLVIWLYIAMPLVKPAIMTVGVLAFVIYWSDFINPLLYLKSDETYTIPVGLRTLQQLDKTNWPILMAASVVMTVPMVVVFLLVQRYIWPEKYLFTRGTQR